tara:strand:+ start:976 stop:1161 length:186 start_codon:yes stop_codon:yes gene_type:complete
MNREEMIENMQYLSDRVLHGEILLMRWMALDDAPTLEGMPKDRLQLMKETDAFITQERKEL